MQRNDNPPVIRRAGRKP